MKLLRLRSVFRTHLWSAWDRVTGTDEGVLRLQYVWWGWPTCTWTWGISPWSDAYKDVGLRYSIGMGPLEVRVWRINATQWGRIMETWRTF